MAKTRVKMNSAGVRELLQSDDIEAYLLSRGDEIAGRMNSLAPVESGQLARSHFATSEMHHDRVVVQIGSALEYALGVAVGTGYMARALDADADPGKTMVRYTTKSGKQRWATQAQVDNWTRGGR